VISEGKGFDGKIVVDATNPIVRSDHGPALGIGWSSSGAEEIAKRAPKAKVFKTFNQTGFENLHHARDYAAPPSMFVAGDDPAGKTIVLQLVQDAGFEAIDFGALDGARLLEPLALIWIPTSPSLWKESRRHEPQGPQRRSPEVAQAGGDRPLQPRYFAHDRMAGRVLVERTHPPLLRLSREGIRGDCRLI
jgi:hypothetical protein